MTTKTKEPLLLPPYGGDLINLMCPEEERKTLALYANSLPSLQLSERSLCDLELLAVGAFSPLDRFMGHADHQSVLSEMRLTSGYIFPIPITLPARSDFEIRAGKDIALCNSQNERLAVLTVEEIYEWNLDETADSVFGTRDSRHPLVAEMNNWESSIYQVPCVFSVCHDITISLNCALLLLKPALVWKSWVIAMWLPFKRAILCTGLMRR